MNSIHLTDDQLDEILLGIGETDASDHLAACSACGERFTAFQAQLDAFNHSTLAWSEARSNTLSREIAAKKPAARITLTAAWSSAAVAMLAVGFAIGASHSVAPEPVANLHAPMVMPAPEAVHQHEIASDNEMLAAIDDEIVTPEPDRFGLYEPATATASVPRTAPDQARD